MKIFPYTWKYCYNQWSLVWSLPWFAAIAFKAFGADEKNLPFVSNLDKVLWKKNFLKQNYEENIC